VAIEIAAIHSAMLSAGFSQRALADQTGISQSTLSRILAGERVAKMPEIILLANALGCTVGQLTGTSLSQRVQCAARASDGASIDIMRQRLVQFMELDAYLEDQGI